MFHWMHFLHATNSDFQTRLLNVFGQIALFWGGKKDVRYSYMCTLHVVTWQNFVISLNYRVYNGRINLRFRGPCIVSIFRYISNKTQRYIVCYLWKLLYMFRVVSPPIIRSAYNCIYNIWYLSNRNCYLLTAFQPFHDSGR